MQPIGIFPWFGYDLSLEQSLRLIYKTGFDRVMLWWGAYENDVPLLKQPALARKIGLDIDNAHAPFYGCNFLWLPGIDGDDYVMRLIHCLQECSTCDIKTVVVHITDGPTPPPFCSLGIERLKNVANIATNLGITLALENLRHPAYVFDALNALPEKSVGLCYDCGHSQIEFSTNILKNGDKLPLIYKNRLTTLHLHDNDGISDQHRLPYDGIRNWDELASILKTSVFSGALMLEVQACNYYEEQMDAFAFLHRAYQTAKRLRTAINLNHTNSI